MHDAVEFERRFQAAIKELETAGVKPVAANPPLTRAARGLGLRVKPPFYMSFLHLAIFMGLPFAIFWGVIMYAMSVTLGGAAGRTLLGLSLFAGLMFGPMMAWLIGQQRKRVTFRPWDAL